MSTMNISDYAKHTGVNRKTISRWMKSGQYIVMSGDEIDVDASDKNLKNTGIVKILALKMRQEKLKSP
ncbi:hypothetical protein J4731_19335 [Providencia rettgeri]|nr:hypothetical protein [Providencia rettgeri]